VPWKHAEKAELLREIAGLLKDGMTVRESLKSWEATNPAKHRELVDCIEQLSIVTEA
jgi:type II secretory pathway component PulF